MLWRRTSASSFVRLAAHAVSERRRVGLLSSCLFQHLQSLPASGRESEPESREGAVVFFSVFQPRPARHRALGAATELSGYLLRPSLFRPLLSPFELTLPPVHPAPFCVEQVVLQRSNPAFGRSKSLRKR